MSNLDLLRTLTLEILYYEHCKEEEKPKILIGILKRIAVLIGNLEYEKENKKK
jgi:hypothetical protein